MKKIIALLLVTIILGSCGTNQDVIVKSGNENIETNNYTVGGKKSNQVNVYGNILNNNVKNLVSHISGKVVDLNCEVGEDVTRNTLIAKITPDYADINYKNNSIQIGSLREQVVNQQSIRASTLLNFDSQTKQLEIQKNDLQSTIKNLKNNLENLKNQKSLTGDDLSLQIDSILNQIKNLEEARNIAISNKEETLKDIKQNISNLKEQIYNTGIKSIERLDETFGISSINKRENDSFDDYLGAKNTSLKNKAKQEANYFISKDITYLNSLSDEELSIEIKKLSDTFKLASDVANNSIESYGTFSKATIDGLYNEFLGYSNALLGYKTNFDKLVNAVDTVSLTFDSQIKELDGNLQSLNTQKINLKNNTTKKSDLTFNTNINNLNNQIETLNNSSKNIDEQLVNLKEKQNSTIKQIDIQIAQLQDSISKTSVLLDGEEIYSGINGVIRQVNVKEGNNVNPGSPICMIVPEIDSLKLEIYSPNQLSTGMEFKYYKDSEYYGTGVIVTESPVKDTMTQNYTYEAEIDFSSFKEGDYLDIKVMTEVSKGEIWLPINYVFPKLDGYYVNLLVGDNIISTKVEVGKMNNGEIHILSGIENGDTIVQ